MRYAEGATRQILYRVFLWQALDKMTISRSGPLQAVALVEEVVEEDDDGSGGDELEDNERALQRADLARTSPSGCARWPP